MLETKKLAGEHAPNPPGICPPPQFHHPDVTDEKYWVRLVDLIDKGNDDVKVKLMHISYPARSFLWPKKDDTCFVPIANVASIIKAPGHCNRKTIQTR